MTRDELETMRHNVASLDPEQAERELAFARGAIDPQSDHGIIWLALLIQRHVESPPALTDDEIERQALAYSEAEYNRLTEIGWSRRDAARHSRMYYEDKRNQLRAQRVT